VELFYREGIMFVNDIVNNDSKMMSNKQLSKVYGDVCSIQKYNKPIAALPQEWKRQLLKIEKK
jgi:hypothetical protein